jgi:Tfp pilus assembly protein PilF
MDVRSSRQARGSLVLGLLALAVGGCLHLDHPVGAGLLSSQREPTPTLGAHQVADIKVALGRTLEKRGELDQAQTAYLEAVKQDPKRGDAWARLGVLRDMQGQFPEASECYRKARLFLGENAPLSCNVGYGFYLQRRWAEAERNLREAIALDPKDQTAHNNFGLVLAHSGRPAEALNEFRKAGCTEAEANMNLALALALEGDLPGARASYERAAVLDPASTKAARGAQQINNLIARAATESQSESGTKVIQAGGTAAATEPPAGSQSP